MLDPLVDRAMRVGVLRDLLESANYPRAHKQCRVAWQ
jgi:hypothetical protein